MTRVAKEVGTEGKLGGQADVKGVSGTWKDLTDNVNGLAANLTAQVRNIAKVDDRRRERRPLAEDHRRRAGRDPRAEEHHQHDGRPAPLVRRRGDARREGGRHRGQARRPGRREGRRPAPGRTSPTTSTRWRRTSRCSCATSSKVATAIANGDLSQKITVDVKGEILQIKDVINKMVDQLNSFAAEVTRVAKEVGTEGKLGGQADVKGVSGTWKDLTDNVNGLAANLTDPGAQHREGRRPRSRTATSSQKITVDAKGEILELKNTINMMVDQLRSFAAEVTRVAKEVGTEGKLGGQADVKGVSGTWKDLTDNVNVLAANLTTQVRNIAKVTTAVAKGDLSQKITVDAKGEILELKNTINVMVDQLNSFAAEVTRVAKEVGTEGKLGGQADVRASPAPGRTSPTT